MEDLMTKEKVDIIFDKVVRMYSKMEHMEGMIEKLYQQYNLEGIDKVIRRRTDETS